MLTHHDMSSFFRVFQRLRTLNLAAAACTGAMLLLGTGCATPSQRDQKSNAAIGQTAPKAPDSAPKMVLREGDVVQVAFPGAPALNTVQTIRRDGRIALPSVGELQASGFSPAELSAELTRIYGPQLVHKEVLVTLVSSSFSVFVSGAVVRPGKVVTDHPISALEAIMEAGGFDSARANLKEVVIIRAGNALPQKLDLKRVLDGRESTPFLLMPGDIVHVPDRLVIF